MNTSDARSRRKAPFLENPSNPDDLVIAGFQPFEAHRVGSFEPAASVSAAWSSSDHAEAALKIREVLSVSRTRECVGVSTL
jgi:hypothetical protein